MNERLAVAFHLSDSEVSTVICPFCKKEIPDHTQFCPECGQTVTSAESTSGASAIYWNSVEKEAERDNKIRIDAENKIQEKKNAKKRAAIGALICIAAVAIAICYFLIIRPAQQYESALALFENGEFSDSLQIFESLGNYKDSTQQAELCRDNIREEDYLAAINLYETGNYSEAISAFRDLDDYQDSKEYIGECEVALINTSSTNEIVTLGVYNGNPIEWLVLSRDESSVLLISKYYVTSKIANENDRGEYGKYMCWSGSTLRTWLNKDFIDEAFPGNVAELLVPNTIQTDEYDVPNYDGWSEVEITVTTEDKVYIPSKADVEHYGLSPTSLMGSSGNTAITGWLRDRGHGIAFQVSYEPDGSYGSEWHFYSSYGIRPIIRISMSGETVAPASDNSITENNEEDVSESETLNYYDTTPFQQKYWVIFTEGYRNDRVEASTIDSDIPAEQLTIIWDSALEISDSSGSDGCDQYYLDDNGEWIYMGNYHRLTDNATNVLASNLDVVDQNGNVVVSRSPYSMIDWNKVDRYR
jgi:hypothetical protein